MIIIYMCKSNLSIYILVLCGLPWSLLPLRAALYAGAKTRSLMTSRTGTAVDPGHRCTCWGKNRFSPDPGMVQAFDLYLS